MTTGTLLDLKPLRHELNFTYLNVIVALQIRYMRESRGWTQQQLAERAKMHASQISELEKVRWDRPPTLNTLLVLSQAFDVAFEARFRSWGEAVSEFMGHNLQGDSAEEWLTVPHFDIDPIIEILAAQPEPEPETKGATQQTEDSGERSR